MTEEDFDVRLEWPDSSIAPRAVDLEGDRDAPPDPGDGADQRPRRSLRDSPAAAPADLGEVEERLVRVLRQRTGVEVLAPLIAEIEATRVAVNSVVDDLRDSTESPDVAAALTPVAERLGSLERTLAEEIANRRDTDAELRRAVEDLTAKVDATATRLEAGAAAADPAPELAKVRRSIADLRSDLLEGGVMRRLTDSVEALGAATDDGSHAKQLAAIRRDLAELADAPVRVDPGFVDAIADLVTERLRSAIEVVDEG